tara:strand:+ start:1245 stop:1472 length:228 start_codon:yes stop_codon:yes gene_type:complete
MRLGKVLTAAAAVSLVATPALAQAAPSVERIGASQSEDSELAGGSGIIIAVLAAAAVIAAIVVAVDGGDDEPVSP